MTSRYILPRLRKNLVVSTARPASPEVRVLLTACAIPTPTLATATLLLQWACPILALQKARLELPSLSMPHDRLRYWEMELRFSPACHVVEAAGSQLRWKGVRSISCRWSFLLLSLSTYLKPPHLPSWRFPPEERGEIILQSQSVLPSLQTTMARLGDRHPLHIGPYSFPPKVGFTLLPLDTWCEVVW